MPCAAAYVGICLISCYANEELCRGSVQRHGVGNSKHRSASLPPNHLCGQNCCWWLLHSEVADILTISSPLLQTICEEPKPRGRGRIQGVNAAIENEYISLTIGMRLPGREREMGIRSGEQKCSQSMMTHTYKVPLPRVVGLWGHRLHSGDWENRGYDINMLLLSQNAPARNNHSLH